MTPSWYDRYILPHALDIACGLPMIGRQRQLVVPLAKGRVPEVGIGTGLDVELVGLSAEEISLPDASFDTVLVTCTLCTIVHLRPQVHRKENRHRTPAPIADNARMNTAPQPGPLAAYYGSEAVPA